MTTYDRRYVIIGNGVAGTIAAETLRKNDPNCSIHQGCCKIGNKQGSKGRLPLGGARGVLASSPPLPAAAGGK